MLEMRAENTKEVTTLHNKHKGTAQKEISGFETSEAKNSTSPDSFGNFEHSKGCSYG
jgi:hypothetical protein